MAPEKRDRANGIPAYLVAVYYNSLKSVGHVDLVCVCMYFFRYSRKI